jgi:hypothetical protein
MMSDVPGSGQAAASLEAMECPMLRIPLVTPGTEPPEVTPIYDYYREAVGVVPRYIQLLAHVPAIAKSWMIFDRDVKVGSLRSGDRERVRFQVLAILKTSLINVCNN